MTASSVAALSVYTMLPLDVITGGKAADSLSLWQERVNSAFGKGDGHGVQVRRVPVEGWSLRSRLDSGFLVIFFWSLHSDSLTKIAFPETRIKRGEPVTIHDKVLHKTKRT